MNDKEELGRVVERALYEQQLASTRAGKARPFWCYYCGHSGTPLNVCDCGFGEAFGCGSAGRKICAACSEAHHDIASHVQSMLTARRVNRVSSIRGKLYRELHRAALEIGGEDPTNPRELRFHLAQADAYDDEPDIFRARILRAFGRARFLNFQALAEQLKKQSDESLIRALVRSGMFR